MGRAEIPESRSLMSKNVVSKEAEILQKLQQQARQVQLSSSASQNSLFSALPPGQRAAAKGTVRNSSDGGDMNALLSLLIASVPANRRDDPEESLGVVLSSRRFKSQDQTLSLDAVKEYFDTRGPEESSESECTFNVEHIPPKESMPKQSTNPLHTRDATNVGQRSTDRDSPAEDGPKLYAAGPEIDTIMPETAQTTENVADGFEEEELNIDIDALFERMKSIQNEIGVPTVYEDYDEAHQDSQSLEEQADKEHEKTKSVAEPGTSATVVSETLLAHNHNAEDFRGTLADNNHEKASFEAIFREVFASLQSERAPEDFTATDTKQIYEESRQNPQEKPAPVDCSGAARPSPARPLDDSEAPPLPLKVSLYNSIFDGNEPHAQQYDVENGVVLNEKSQTIPKNTRQKSTMFSMKYHSTKTAEYGVTSVRLHCIPQLTMNDLHFVGSYVIRTLDRDNWACVRELNTEL